MKQILRTLTIEQIEAVQNYLEQNPAWDRYEQPVEMDDLDMDVDGNIQYCYSWKTRSECNDSTGFNTVTEMYDEQYITLLTKEQLEAEVKSRKENAN